MSKFNIYKLAFINNDNISEIDVYIGDLNKKDIDIYDIFTDKEQKDITLNNTKINYINDFIHDDDTIDIIKKKIMFKHDLIFEEIYLFTNYAEKININKIYEKLRLNKNYINKNDLKKFILNIQNLEIDINLEKDKYNYQDLIELNIPESLIINIELGQKFIHLNNELLNIVNPYLIENYKEIILENLHENVKTFNKNLLLNSIPYYKSYNNIIYICLLKDIINYNKSKTISESNLIDLYFPYISQLKINNIDSFQKEYKELKKKNNNLLNKAFISYNDNINLLNRIYYNKTVEQTYYENGIKKIEFKIFSEKNTNIPIEVIFKLINSSLEIPLIKYNPSNHVDKIYRLYTDKISTKGKKIPYLNKSTIFKVMKSIGKSKTLSFYINIFNKNIILLCELSNEGYIRVILENEVILSIEDVEDIINKHVNNLLNKIQKIIEQKENFLPKFLSFKNENINILELEYSYKIDIDKSFNLKNIINCISSVFNVEEGNLEKGIKMRYKRIENYSELDSIESYIIESFNKDKDTEEIIDNLQENFSYEREEAEKKVSEILSTIDVVSSLYKKKEIRIKKNPGFLTTINKEKFTNSIIININNINNFIYLTKIFIYIDSLLRLILNPKSTTINTDEINKLCKKKTKTLKIDEVIPEIQKESVEDIEELDLINKDPDNDDDEDDKLMNLLLGLDDNSDDENDVEKENKEGEEIIGGSGEIITNQIKLGDSLSTLSSNGDEGKSESGESQSGESQSGESQPGESQPGESQSGESQPGESQPGESQPGESQSGESQSGESQSGESQPGAVTFGEDLSLSSDNENSEDEDLSSLTGEKDMTEGVQDQVNELKESEQDEVLPSLTGEKDQDVDQDVAEQDEVLPSLTSDKGQDEAKQDEAGRDQVNEQKESEQDEVEQDEVLPSLTSDKEQDEVLPSLTSDKEENEAEQDEAEQDEAGQDVEKPSDILEPKQFIISKKKDKSKKIDMDENKNIEDMPLNNPNPFSQRLEKRDPKLFVINIEDKKYKAYSRQCQSNARRQPVILTDEEKEKIDREHPGSYNKAIKYGSDPKNQYWYICPRYWSFLKNSSLTKEEVDSGNYGKVIPYNAKKVPGDTSIFEFTSKEHLNGDKYIDHYPGFILNKESHPDGFCLPCCFKSWDTPSQKRRRDECLEKNIPDNKLEKKTKLDIDNYIKGPDKFPIDENRWGYLPLTIQNFLDTDNKLCQISINNSNLKKNYTCILRQGVNNNKYQSFIACISLIYSQIKSLKEVLSINDMKKIIIENINIDNFIIYQNGNLVNFFKTTDISENNFDLYKETNLYKNINMSNENQVKYFNNVINSYNNFINYLKKNNEYIDYVYLWDIICSPNINLFKDGINLIILEIPDNDVTNNLNLICPSNHYSNSFFDYNKRTLILIKKGYYYEVICTVFNTDIELKIQYLFNLKDEDILPNLKNSINSIAKSLEDNCSPKIDKSKKNEYIFKENIISNKIIKSLSELSYKVLEQIMNYDNKVIALLIQKYDNIGYIPTYPSNLIIDLNTKITWIDDVKWFNYINTRDFLFNLHKESNQKILCKPLLKVIEDSLIIGILTETNQFIGISPPETDMYGDDLESVNESNYLVADTKSILYETKDIARVNYILKIKLENDFYSVFRNTVQLLLDENNNKTIRDNIINIINLNEKDYSNKIKSIVDELNNLCINHIEFIKYDEKIINELDDIKICLINNKEDCNNKKYCKYDDINNVCKLLISKNNLINDSDNSQIYFLKVADELIRFVRKKDIILNNNNILLTNLKFRLNTDEILILQSLLTQEYFEGIEISKYNKIIFNNVYDNINPSNNNEFNKIIKFKNINKKDKLVLKEEQEPEEQEPEEQEPEEQEPGEQEPEEQEPEEREQTIKKTKKSKKSKKIIKIIKDETEKDETEKDETEKDDREKDYEEVLDELCVPKRKKLSANMSLYFTKNLQLIEYSNDEFNCSFKIIIDILKDNKSDINAIINIKYVLIEEYNKIDNKSSIVSILEKDGKKDLSQKLNSNEIDMNIMIMNENYYLTNFDIILLSKRLNLPIIIISSEIKILNISEDNNYYIIKQPIIKYNEVLKYKLIIENKETFKINKDYLSITIQQLINNKNIFDIKLYIDHFNDISDEDSEEIDIDSKDEDKDQGQPDRLIKIPLIKQ